MMERVGTRVGTGTGTDTDTAAEVTVTPWEEGEEERERERELPLRVAACQVPGAGCVWPGAGSERLGASVWWLGAGHWVLVCWCAGVLVCWCAGGRSTMLVQSTASPRVLPRPSSTTPQPLYVFAQGSRVSRSQRPAPS